MDQPTTLPFLSLSEDEQLLILKKLENSGIKRISSTCSDANNLIERHKTVLSSRPQHGQPIKLITDDEFIDLEFRRFRFKVWDDFQERIRGLSFSSLEIVINDHSTVPQLVDMLKNWKQSFPVVYLPEDIQPSIILELTNALTSSGWIHLPKCLNINSLTELQEAENGSKFRIEMSMVHYENQFDLIRNFGDITMKITPKTLITFLWDLHNAKSAGKLKRVSFSFKPPEENRKTPFLLGNQDLPPNKSILPTFPLSVQKLSLNKNMCALIEEYTNRLLYSKKSVTVTIIKDSDEAILDYLLELLRISSDVFTESQRQEYLMMNDEERAICIRKASKESKEKENYGF